MLSTLICVVLAPAPQLAAAEWPSWRGPDGNGVATQAVPTTWSDEENVRWRIEIPGLGYSTPVVSGDRIFLTTAVPTGKQPAPSGEEGNRGGRRRGGWGGTTPTEQAFTVMCLDRTSGALIWRKVLRVATPHEGYHRQYGSWASYSPVVVGDKLFVSFGSQGVWCLSVDGEEVWRYDPEVKLRIRNSFGEGANFVVHGDTLFHLFDQESGSFAVALDAAKGEERWRVDRDEPTTWATPLVVEHEGVVQVVASGTRRVRSYRLADGELLWECGGLGTNAIPAVLRHDDLVLAMSGYRNANLIAIRLGGEGDLTDSDHVMWTSGRGLAYTASPVLLDGNYYVVMDRGFISCFDAATGEAHYLEQRLPRGSTLKSSPIAAGEHLYVATESGDVHVIALGDELEVVATNTLEGQFFVASPVPVEAELLLRSKTHLFCISEGGETGIEGRDV